VVVTANTDDAPKTLAELLTRLREKPGTFGSLGVGTIGQLASELLLHRAGVKALHVPYKSGYQADVATGLLTFASITIADATPLIRAGKLRALAVTTPQRVPSLPSVPTVSESANAEFKLDGFKVGVWYGLFAPAGTPAGAVDKLSGAIIAALKRDDIKQKFNTLELVPTPLDPAQLGNLLDQELPMWTDFIHRIDLKIE